MSPSAQVAERPLNRQERNWLLRCGTRYWSGAHERIGILRLPSATVETGRLIKVAMPGWAADLGVGDPPGLLVDSGCVIPGEGPAWERCDWWRAAFQHLTGALEQRHDEIHGPVHSYAHRLGSIDAAAFDKAWVNRIFLYLRRLAARTAGAAEDRLFAPLPPPVIELSHDVDAVTKTVPIRIKNSAFQFFNSARLAARGRFGRAGQVAVHGARFMLTHGDYWRFQEVARLEEERDLRSVFHLFGGGEAPWRSWLMDPGYSLGTQGLVRELAKLQEGGWAVGAHPGYYSWDDSERLAAERRAVEVAIGGPVRRCRQHWLRFSWARSWRAQEAAGFALDSTLGFNDRPGFRNGAAIRIQPWDSARNAPLNLEILPMVLMDSHLYDYELVDQDRIGDQIKRWTDEIRAVRGEASVNWHVHVMSPDYGWAPGFRALLDAVA